MRTSTGTDGAEVAPDVAGSASPRLKALVVIVILVIAGLTILMAMINPSDTLRSNSLVGIGLGLIAACLTTIYDYYHYRRKVVR